MPSLYAYSNSENTALVILQRKGYQLWYDPQREIHYAEKNGWDFAASGAMELLGAVSVFEYQNPQSYSAYWWKLDKPQLLRNLPSQPQPFKSVITHMEW